jgi:hypothetical protein
MQIYLKLHVPNYIALKYIKEWAEAMVAGNFTAYLFL